MQKLYAYVDESGQDTVGRMFVVGVVVLEKEYDHILKELKRIEEISKKQVKKWHRALYQYRQAYVNAIAHSPIFHGALFFEIFTNSKQYIEMTSFATAKAILKKVTNDDYTATVFVDGFRKPEIELFMQGLRDLHIKRRKIRGVRNEESESFILLADALCGLIRDADGGDEWAILMLNKMKKDGIVTAL